MAKVKVNLSLDESTAKRLKTYAEQKHTTVSQAVTDWIWRQTVDSSYTLNNEGQWEFSNG